MATSATKPPAATAKKANGRGSLATSTDLVRAMWTGDAGKGKTYDMAHMAKLGHVVIIDAEKRLKKGPLVRAGVPLENIEPRLCTVDEPLSYKSIMDLGEELRGRIMSGEEIYGVIWDSATEIHRVLLGDLVGRAVIQAERAGKERDEWKTYQEDYGDMTEQMRKIIRKYRDLPVHFAMSTLAKRDQDEEGGVRVSPALTPAVLRDYVGYMDIVINKRVEIVNGQDEYSGYTRPTGRFEAKDAFGVLPRILVNPTFDRVMGYVDGTLNRETDPIQLAAKAARKQQAEAAGESAAEDD